MIGVGISTWRAGVLGGDSGVALGVGGTTLTALAQILALDPVALWWPTEGSGWQGRTGGDLSAVGSPVGILPDLSELGGATLDEWLANPTTPELVTNGGFDTDTYWGKDSAWTIAGGVATYAGATSNQIYSPNDLLTVGKLYRITFDVVTVTTAGSLPVLVGGSSTTLTISTTGTYTVQGIASAEGRLRFGAGTGSLWRGSIDNISVRELPGIHAIAPTDAARPLLAAGPILDFDAVDDQLAGTLADGTYYLATVATDGTVAFTSTAISGGTGLVIDTDMTALIVRGTDFTAGEQATIEGLFA